MRRGLLIVAWTVVVSGCGGAVATSPTSDGGSTQTTSTTSGTASETGVSTCSGPPLPGQTCGSNTMSVTGTASLSAYATASATGTNIYTMPDAADGTCTISPSNYDQLCSVDTDCMLVTTGNYCNTGCLCETGAINVNASAAFSAAIEQTPVGSGAARAGDCPCAPVVGPCCRQGQCTTDCPAPNALDAGPAADSGDFVVVESFGGGTSCPAPPGYPADQTGGPGSFYLACIQGNVQMCTGCQCVGSSWNCGPIMTACQAYNGQCVANGSSCKRGLQHARRLSGGRVLLLGYSVGPPSHAVIPLERSRLRDDPSGVCGELVDSMPPEAAC